ncbi:hypothetical protein EKO27_g3076 [Xylaria grammica]|uniref:Uncharacterized protein n=1 Tax=Xylaria grammica TaxID=363999 RepID=A0A439DCA8_9PEZI|nr:hypothetical protein EKO27_g3076 [Xylaria grammica]
MALGKPAVQKADLQKHELTPALTHTGTIADYIVKVIPALKAELKKALDELDAARTLAIATNVKFQEALDKAPDTEDGQALRDWARK